MAIMEGFVSCLDISSTLIVHAEVSVFQHV